MSSESHLSALLVDVCTRVAALDTSAPQSITVSVIDAGGMRTVHAMAWRDGEVVARVTLP